MPLTTTGRLVKPGGTEHPSLVDIAVALSRQPRFAGHCRRQWTVLDHVLFCHELSKQDWTTHRLHSLAILLHDAHEAITADVPTDMKTDDLRRTQSHLDARIYDAYFPDGYKGYIFGNFDEHVKWIDRRALCAEARVVGPPATPERTLELFGVCEETHEDVRLLESLLYRKLGGLGVGHLGYLGIAPQQNDQRGHPTVEEYLRRMAELM